jgi:hypothetical protein
MQTIKKIKLLRNCSQAMMCEGILSDGTAKLGLAMEIGWGHQESRDSLHKTVYS